MTKLRLHSGTEALTLSIRKQSATNPLLHIDVLVLLLSKLWHESLFHFHEILKEHYIIK